ncbi:calcium-binding protein [Croceibacterium ferulae]|uniref:calcium-binding protein n=1 Tax=Croceibacterium ferulae TaxID=1854641 RepID=UPI0013906B38|nr:calcium-binding protein [Croceibacterium ferulae]
MFDTSALVQTQAEWETVTGTDGDDFLNSGHNGSTLDGDDTLTTGYLGAGYTGELYATQIGGSGRDNLSVLINAFTYYSYTSLSGGAGADRLAVNSTLTNDDADKVALVENYLFGGAGADVIDVDAVLSSASGGNIVNEVYGGAGADTITMTARVVDGTDIELASNYAQGGAGNDTIYATGYGDADDYLINEVYGNNGNDIIIARIEGEAYGESYVDGGAGDDVLQVINGYYNELYGMDGNDTLRSGTGIDIMSGGEGADRFDFFQNGGDDVILDFEVGTDTIALFDGQTIGSLSNVDGGTLVSFADGASVLLQNVVITDQAQLFA